MKKEFTLQNGKIFKINKTPFSVVSSLTGEMSKVIKNNITDFNLDFENKEKILKLAIGIFVESQSNEVLVKKLKDFLSYCQYDGKIIDFVVFEEDERFMLDYYEILYLVCKNYLFEIIKRQSGFFLQLTASKKQYTTPQE